MSDDIATADELPIEGEDGMFPALLAGIREFRARVEGRDEDSGGDYRARILALQSRTGLIKDIVVAVLDGLRVAFEWLHEALTKIDDYLIFFDVIMAFIEVFGAGTRALGDMVDSVGDDLPDELAVIGELGEPIRTVGSTLESIPDLIPPNIIPQPGAITAIVSELAALVGEDPSDEASTGSLDELLDQLQAAA